MKSSDSSLSGSNNPTAAVIAIIAGAVCAIGLAGLAIWGIFTLVVRYLVI